ncbi:MAG: KH domain-containing protein [Nitrospira sp.]|nr:KH domain-containing protein [Nitrospira sp.]
METPRTDYKLRELVEYIAKSLVDRPEDVSVKETEGEKTTIVELHVAQEDLGKVIGKQGKTARAMRTIMNAASIKMGKRCYLEILE